TSLEYSGDAGKPMYDHGFRFQNEFSSQQRPKATEGLEKVVRIKVVEGFYSLHSSYTPLGYSGREIFQRESGSRNSSETAPDVIFVPDWRTEVTCRGVRRKLNTRPVPRRPISVERTLCDRHTVPRRVSRAATVER
ncbi:PREDICTED: uncharacterized protein LOC108545779, partial [Eufriesea mexicana]|uniref:uncharacterized protein LOC108545779 n=1 Tax=Eufriesea mexicana TaxID=516756 RepID=UPI00083C5F7D